MSEYGEPWTYNNTYEVLLNCDGRLITQIHNGFGSPPVMDWEPCGDGREELRRIVACVNACRGIPTEELDRRGQQAGNTSLVCSMLQIAGDFYAGGGYDAFPRGAVIKPRITCELGGMQFLGENIGPYESDRHIHVAEELLKHHGYTVAPPKS